MRKPDIHFSLVDAASRNHAGAYKVTEMAWETGGIVLRLEYVDADKATKKLDTAILTFNPSILPQMLALVLSRATLSDELDQALWESKQPREEPD